MSEIVAAYRLQLNAAFGFTDVLAILPYLRDLGVSHLYLSPIWQARSGSLHGYDVTDPARISHELGGEERFVELARTDFGIILDIVPNHMAAVASNPYWNDEQLREQFFDVDTATGFRRRFFDVDDLVGVRVEVPEVFAVTHRKVKELIKTGAVEGLRIDHIDGLADPATYLDRIAQMGAEHVWVEKILGHGEELRSWPIEGTTGYDYLNDLTALFVEPSSETTLTKLSGEHRNFAEISVEAKLEQVANTFQPEVSRLRSLVDTDHIAPALAALPVYRTYVYPGRDIDEADRVLVSLLPEPVRSLFEQNANTSKEFIIRFQQTTSAVMAKGVEDTAMYRYVRLLALNEVGGDPQRFGLTVEEFHLANERRHSRFPQSFVSSQTHDTKRSGDVRARLIALSHRADDWSITTQKWHQINAKWRVNGAPDWTEELFIYQTLIGGWPIELDRLGPYVLKALREAKRNTNWVAPNVTWEQRVLDFCEHLDEDREFLDAFRPFAELIALAGERIAIGQLVLRLSSPGVPDIYQGDETWNFSFVDPDNRRPIDWVSAESSMRELLLGSTPIHRSNAKLYVTKIMLDLRHRHGDSFRGSYTSLTSSPSTCAYRRGNDLVVAAALRDQPIAFDLPKGSWTSVLEPLETIYDPVPVTVFERTDS